MLTASFGAMAGCSDEADDTIDCAQICNKYDECVTEIDVTSCTDQCEDMADASDATRARLEECEACVEDVACAEATTCWADCPVVPAGD